MNGGDAALEQRREIASFESGVGDRLTSPRSGGVRG